MLDVRGDVASFVTMRKIKATQKMGASRWCVLCVVSAISSDSLESLPLHTRGYIQINQQRLLQSHRERE